MPPILQVLLPLAARLQKIRNPIFLYKFKESCLLLVRFAAGGGGGGWGVEPHCRLLWITTDPDPPDMASPSSSVRHDQIPPLSAIAIVHRPLGAAVAVDREQLRGDPGSDKT